MAYMASPREKTSLSCVRFRMVFSCVRAPLGRWTASRRDITYLSLGDQGRADMQQYDWEPNFLLLHTLSSGLLVCAGSTAVDCLPSFEIDLLISVLAINQTGRLRLFAPGHQVSFREASFEHKQPLEAAHERDSREYC